MSYSSILEAIKSASEITPDKICLGDIGNAFSCISLGCKYVAGKI